MKHLIEKWAGKAITELGTSKRFFDAGDFDNAIRYGGLATGIMSVVKDMEAALPEWDSKDAELTRLRAEVERLTAALAAETLAVDRLVKVMGNNCPPRGGALCGFGVGSNDCAACWAAWARQPKDTKEVER